MMHEAILAAPDVDPDVVQAIIDFRSVVERIRTDSLRAAKAVAGSHERRALEKQIRSDMDLLRVRAERLGDGWTDASLLIAVQMDLDVRARRVSQPIRANQRVHDDRVANAVARQQAARTALATAQAELEGADSHLAAVQHAARHFEARRAAR